MMTLFFFLTYLLFYQFLRHNCLPGQFWSNVSEKGKDLNDAGGTALGSQLVHLPDNVHQFGVVL
jgi:hypothetical protein